MKKIPSAAMVAFLKTYLKWVKKGAPIDNKYHYERHSGLCHAAASYRLVVKQDLPIDSELKRLLIATMGDHTYPFGESRFNEGLHTYTNYLDKRRLKWVKKMIKKGELGEPVD